MIFFYENYYIDNANTFIRSKIGQTTLIMVKTTTFQKKIIFQKSSKIVFKKTFLSKVIREALKNLDSLTVVKLGRGGGGGALGWEL